MEDAVNKLKSLSNDAGFISELEHKQIEEYASRIASSQERKEAKEEGINEGKHQRNVEIAKNMIEEGTDIKFISSITGLSIEEIKKL